jgi:hypothetical protein
VGYVLYVTSYKYHRYTKNNGSNKIFYVDTVKIVSKENNETYLNVDVTHFMQCRRKTLLVSSL